MSVEASLPSRESLVKEKPGLLKGRLGEPDNQEGPSRTYFADTNYSPNVPSQIEPTAAPDNATTPKTPIPTDALRAPDRS